MNSDRLGVMATCNSRIEPNTNMGPGAVQRYYDETWLDYRVLWLNRRNLAFHFGYHDEGTASHADALINTNRVLAARARVGAGSRVLDAGCGLGGSGFWLARNRGATVVGVALGHEQVARAHRLAHAQQLSARAGFLQADFTSTPFRSASFDVVWALESLCHAPEKAAFYREAARLLRPGGRLVVADFMLVRRSLDPRQTQRLREWLDGWAIPHLSTVEEHRRDAEKAGLGEATVEDFTTRARPSLRRLYRIARYTYPLAWTARRLGIRSAVQHGNVIGAVRQYQALRDGCWMYGVLCATKPGR
jgi:tocopherol O-methyltransferase